MDRMMNFSHAVKSLTIVDGTVKLWRMIQSKIRNIFCLAGGDWQVLSTEWTVCSDESILFARTNTVLRLYSM